MSLPPYLHPFNKDPIAMNRHLLSLDISGHSPFFVSKLEKLSNLYRYLPACRSINNVPIYKDMDVRIKRMQEYLEIQHLDCMDAWTRVETERLEPPNIKETVFGIGQILRGELINERKLRKFDVFAGNLMCPLNLKMGKERRLAVARGTIGDEIGSTPVIHATAKFKTPITQITTCDTKILIRSYEGCHMLNLDTYEQNLVTFGQQPLHIAASSCLPEAAVMLRDGSVYIWDLNTNLREWSPAGAAVQKDKNEWKTCEYGQHPRSLLMADRSLIVQSDLRESLRQNSQIFSSPSSNITGMKSLKPFYQIAIAAGMKCHVVDTRYPKRTLFDWEVGCSYEHMTNIEVLGDGFLTWGRHYGEIMGYEETSKITKYSSFYTHSSFGTRELNSKGVYLDSSRLKNQFMEQQDIPPWGTLTGVCAVDNRIFQLTDSGSAFMQNIAPGEIEQMHKWEIGIIEEPLEDSFSGASHEILDFSDILTMCNRSFEKPVDVQEEKATLEITHSMYDIYKSVIDFSVTPCQLPALAMTIDDVRTKIKNAARQIAPDWHFIERMDNFCSLGPSKAEFKDGFKVLAQKAMTADLILASSIIIPPSHVTLCTNASIASHTSQVSSHIYDNVKTFTGIPSWLFEQWDRDDAFDVFDYNPDIWSSANRANSEDCSETSGSRRSSEYGGSRRSSDMGSSRRGSDYGGSEKGLKRLQSATDRSDRQLKIRSEGYSPTSMTQPIPVTLNALRPIPSIIRAASQPLDTRLKKGKKRKSGF